MQGFRPHADGRYLDRLRLLDRLPDRPGHVVWLEAPYGYGKSVLASQWAAVLEGSGWRTVWLSGRYESLTATLAASLGLPPRSTLPVVLDAVWTGKTLLVLEDLEGLADPEQLSPLLRDVRGLLLLASRGGLGASELPRSLTQGRLLHLRAEDLAFSQEETSALFRDDATSARVHELTKGWPLPLHFASITGELPERAPLVEGMRESIAHAEWEEALLLSTVHHLPAGSACQATRALADGGFVQLGETGYRIHPLVSDHLLEAYAEEARTVLHRERERLPELLLGEAFERCGDLAALEELFEAPRRQVYRQAPETFLRWDTLIGGRPSSRRHMTVGGSLKVLGRFEESVDRLSAALADEDLTSEDRVLALKDMCWSQAIVDPESAARTVSRGEALLDQVDDELAGRFLSDSSFVDVMAGRLDDAATKLRRALDRLPPDNSFRTGAYTNLALNRWDRHGDYDGRLAAQTEALDEVWRVYPSDAPGQCRDLAMLHMWAGETSKAREYLERARSGARSNPLIRLEATAALAALDGDERELSALLATAARWGDAYTLDAVGMYAIDTLRPGRPAVDAKAIFDAVDPPILTASAYALLMAGDDHAGALRLIDEASQAAGARAYRLYLTAARYRITREEADLDEFLSLTTAGARLLPGFVPLGELPGDRPDLSVNYALDRVLDSGWTAAIELRLAEVPDLELKLVGGFELRLRGRPVELTDRQKQMVTLFVMGRDRQEVAEALWPDVDADRQRNNMGVQVSLLRAALEPWALPTFVFKDGLKRVRSDYESLLVALEDGDAATVLRLYDEPFAAGLQVDEITEHGSWLRQRALTCLCDGARSTNHHTAIGYLSRALELDPLNEDVLRALLLRLREAGQTHMAQRHLATFEERLMQETGLEPLPETLAVLQGV